MGIENMSNEQMKEVIKKVQKLLALAQSDNENEARLALQKAQELQAKYNIVFDQLDIEDESQKVIEEKYDAPDTESLNSLFKMMACSLADHYRVKTYINIHREWATVNGSYQRTMKKQLVVVGLPFDVEVRCVSSQRRLYVSSPITTRVRKSFSQRMTTALVSSRDVSRVWRRTK